MLRHVALVRTDVSEEHSPSIITVTRHFFAAFFGCQLLLTFLLACRFFHPDDGDDMFLRSVGSHKSISEHTSKTIPLRGPGYQGQSLPTKPDVCNVKFAHYRRL
jgi:hypothetical protein